MILFGYKSKFNSILRGLSAIAIGLVLLFGTGRGEGASAVEIVVKIIAAFLMIAGVVTFIYGWKHRTEGAVDLMWVNGAADLIIGLLLFFFPSVVSGFIITLVGIALLCFGALQFIVMAGAMSLIGAGFTSLILSCLAIIGGVMIVFSNFGQTVLSWIAGIALIMYGAQELIQTYKLRDAGQQWEIRKAQRDQTAKIDKTALETAKEVEYTKVEDSDDPAGDS